MIASTSQQGGLVPTDLFDIGGPDDAARNAKRFERIWEEEKQRCENTPQKPSLNRSNFNILQKYLYSRPFHTNRILEIANGVGVGVDSWF